MPAQFFTKCGILKDDDDGKPRVKLYRDRASGMLKGDGLVYYLKQPSVSCACPARSRAMSCPGVAPSRDLMLARLRNLLESNAQMCFSSSNAPRH